MEREPSILQLVMVDWIYLHQCQYMWDFTVCKETTKGHEQVVDGGEDERKKGNESKHASGRIKTTL